MSEENQRDELLKLLEKIHTCANNLRNEVVALHQIIRFDHQSPGAREEARRIEDGLTELADGLRHFREVFDAKGRAA